MKGPLFLTLAALALALPGAKAFAEDFSNSSSDGTAEVMAMLAPETETRDEAPSSLTLTPALGLFLSEPSELNSWLSSHTLNGQSVAGQITWASAVSVSARYELTRQLSLGLRLEYADVQCSRKVTYNEVSQGLNSELSWLLPSLTADYRFPVSSRISLGIAVAMGVPLFYHLGLQETGAQSGSATYAANPLSASAGAFATFELSRRAELRFETGYRFLDASQMSATSQGTDAWNGIASAAPLVSSNGAVIPVDASAPYFEAGMTFHL